MLSPLIITAAHTGLIAVANAAMTMSMMPRSWFGVSPPPDQSSERTAPLTRTTTEAMTYHGYRFFSSTIDAGTVISGVVPLITWLTKRETSASDALLHAMLTDVHSASGRTPFQQLLSSSRLGGGSPRSLRMIAQPMLDATMCHVE